MSVTPYVTSFNLLIRSGFGHEKIIRGVAESRRIHIIALQ